MRSADRSDREHPEPRAPLRLRRLLLLSMLVGAAGALVGFAYLALLHLLEGWWGPGTSTPLVQLALLAATGLFVGLLVARLGATGDVELVMDDIHVPAGRRAELRRLRSLLPVSLACISAGGGAGPEAPLVQTTGTLAQWLALRLRLSPLDRRIMTIAGMAAAFTVLFGAPIGAAVFALEILHRRGLQYYEALLPAVVASLVGYSVYVAASGLGLTPVWSFPAQRDMQPFDLALAAGAGVLGALVALGFAAGVRMLRSVLEPVPELWRPAAGGLALGLLGLASPFALTYGKYQVDPMLAMGGSAAFFALAALAKVAGTAVTVASGWRGGYIIPLFFMGIALARAIGALAPAVHEPLLAAALMAAINTGVTKTPIGSTLVVAKMTGLALVPSTATAAVVALLLTHRLGLIDAQREQRLVREESGESAPPTATPRARAPESGAGGRDEAAG